MNSAREPSSDPAHYVIRVLSLADGLQPTPFDGQWVKEYDPTRAGTSPDGLPMIAHLVTTSDPTEAVQYGSFREAAEVWRLADGRRADGRTNRPLTAFNCTIEPLEEAIGSRP